MSYYCFVEDNKVTHCGEVPKNWRNVTRLDLASDAELKEKGWLPYIEQPITLSTYEVRDGTEFKIEVDRVVGIEKKRAMTDKEKSEQDQQIATQYQRDRRPKYGDWEEQLDMMYHSMDDWKAHCKAVRDKYPKPE
jgi:hypothetical protein